MRLSNALFRFPAATLLDAEESRPLQFTNSTINRPMLIDTMAGFHDGVGGQPDHSICQRC